MSILEETQSRNMQAYKLKGKIDEVGQLILTEPVQIPPGDVEVIVLQLVPAMENVKYSETKLQPEKVTKESQSGVRSLRELLENTPPVPPEFDAEQARWEALKEKHNL